LPVKVNRLFERQWAHLSLGATKRTK
jgi:hypothetical protein